MNRRDFLRGAMATVAYGVTDPRLGFAASLADNAAPSLALPTAAQKAWADMELGMFFHFDIPIYKTGWRWRSFANYPDPSLYNPARLDTDQWMEVRKRTARSTLCSSPSIALDFFSGKATSIPTELSNPRGAAARAIW